MKNILMTWLVAILAIAGADRLHGQIEVEFDSQTVTVGAQATFTASIVSLSGSEILTAYNLPVDVGADGFGMPAGVSIVSIDNLNSTFANFNSSPAPGAPFNFDVGTSDSDAVGVGLSASPVNLFSVTIQIDPSFPITQFELGFQDSPTPNPGLFAFTLDGGTFNAVDTVMAGTITTRPLIKGDVNLDGIVNLLDVLPFINVVGSGEFQIEADTNCDGELNLLDVQPFIAIVSGG